MKYPKHEDVRGYFQEIARASDTLHAIRQVGIFSINPGQTRGDHYHRELFETFVVIEGECVVTSSLGHSGSLTTKKLAEGDSIVFIPLVQHKFYSEKGCKILALANKEFDTKNPDVYKY
jgi:quercetin dioxygenase-like cupin family protein